MEMVVKDRLAAANEKLDQVLAKVVADQKLHALWLNTLSFMEHIGATKIAKTQNGPLMEFTLLKHASEEARHAFYLKHLSRKVDLEACPTYEDQYLLAARQSKQYLYKLDLIISRAAREFGYSGKELHDLTYLLVTYAIEIRADDIYPIYENHLKSSGAPVSVMSIILEEEGHLNEMKEMLEHYPPKIHAYLEKIEAIESELYSDWIAALEREIN